MDACDQYACEVSRQGSSRDQVLELLSCSEWLRRFDGRHSDNCGKFKFKLGHDLMTQCNDRLLCLYLLLISFDVTSWVKRIQFDKNGGVTHLKAYLDSDDFMDCYRGKVVAES